MTLKEALQRSTETTKRGRIVNLVRKALLALPQSEARDKHLSKIGFCTPCLPQAILFLKANGIEEIDENV